MSQAYQFVNTRQSERRWSTLSGLFRLHCSLGSFLVDKERPTHITKV